MGINHFRRFFLIEIGVFGLWIGFLVIDFLRFWLKSEKMRWCIWAVAVIWWGFQSFAQVFEKNVSKRGAFFTFFAKKFKKWTVVDKNEHFLSVFFRHFSKVIDNSLLVACRLWLGAKTRIFNHGLHWFRWFLELIDFRSIGMSLFWKSNGTSLFG